MSVTEVAPGARRVPGESLMRGNYYAESSYCRTDICKGVTRNRSGTRLIALSQDFLLGFRRAIADECGPAAEVVFKTCGKKWGTMCAQRFEKELGEFYGKPVREFMFTLFHACLEALFNHHGWGKVKVDLSRHEQGLLVVDLEGAVMADLVEQADQPVDTLMAGILAGFFSHLSGQDLDCVQTQCLACGAASSKFIIGLGSRLAPVGAWVNQGKSHADVVNQLANVRA